MMPYFMKNAINSVSGSVINPMVAISSVILYTCSTISMTYFEGKKTIENSKVI